MKRYDTHKPCTRPSRARGVTCLQQLAEGMILPPDLCQGCTLRFMAALFVYSPEPLDWHSSYVDRAEGGGRGE